jgi:hypothetical protein
VTGYAAGAGSMFRKVVLISLRPALLDTAYYRKRAEATTQRAGARRSTSPGVGHRRSRQLSFRRLARTEVPEPGGRVRFLPGPPIPMAN